MIAAVTLAFAIQKFYVLYLGLDPIINENIQANYYGEENGLNIN